MRPPMEYPTTCTRTLCLPAQSPEDFLNDSNNENALSESLLTVFLKGLLTALLEGLLVTLLEILFAKLEGLLAESEGRQTTLRKK